MKYAVSFLIFLSVFIFVAVFSYIRSGASGYFIRYREAVDKLLKSSLSSIKSSEVSRLVMLFGVLAVLVGAVSGEIILTLVMIPVMIILPKVYVKRKETKYMKDYCAGLSGFLESVISSLKAGISINRAIVMIAEKDKGPVGGEMAVVLRETELGKSLSEALKSLALRIPVRENEIIISAITTSLETGGNITEVLSNILLTIRNREELGRELETLTSQGVLSGIVVGLLPVFLVAVISLLDPEFIAPLFNTTAGLVMAGVAVVMEITGAMMIKRIVTIK